MSPKIQIMAGFFYIQLCEVGGLWMLHKSA
jgi:hypothetical protein